MKDIDKFLTKAIDECWHVNTPMKELPVGKPFKQCPKCNWLECNWGDHNTDFFSWSGMGKLREFYDTWDKEKQYKFRKYALDILTEDNKFNDKVFGDYIWHKDNTANLMYGFLKEVADCEKMQKT